MASNQSRTVEEAELRCLREEHDRVRTMLASPIDDLEAMAAVIGAHALADMAQDRVRDSHAVAS